MSAPTSNGSAEPMTSKDYYFDSYAHFGNLKKFIDLKIFFNIDL